MLISNCRGAMMATSQRRAQYAVRARGSKRCPHHQGKEVVFVCEDCKDLACIECVSTNHKRHALLEISSATPNAKYKIQDFVRRVEKIEVPRIERKLQAVTAELFESEQFFKKQILDIENRNELVKKELDKITKNLVETCRNISKESSESLTSHKIQLEVRVEELNALLQESRDVLQSGNGVQMYDTSTTIPPEFIDIPAPKLPSTEFYPGRYTVPQLEQMLGELVTKKLNESENEIAEKTELVIAKYRSVSTFQPYTNAYVTSIHRNEDDSVWVCGFGFNKNMLLLNGRDGRQNLQLEVNVKDFSVSPRTGHIWMLSVEDHAVQEVQVPGGQSSVRFITDDYPRSICMTSDDHIVIVFIGQIVKYTQRGKIVCKTSDKFTLPPHPKRLTECPVTKQLAVANSDPLGYLRERDSKSYVFVLNNNLQLLYTYNGETPGQQPQIKQPFDPNDVCYTNTGQLVVTERHGSVLLLTGKGEFLKTLFTYTGEALAVSVQSNGDIYVSFNDGSVHVLSEM